MADENKVIVEITKQEAPAEVPNFEWWICYRDKPDDKEFKCFSVNTPEQVSRSVDKLGTELPGRMIWVTALMSAYESTVMVKMLPISSEMAKMGSCVN